MAGVTRAAELTVKRLLTRGFVVHEPLRPAWDCGLCGLPYPCRAAREQLLVRYGLSADLGERAWEMLEQAVRDRPDLTVTELFDRFVAWSLPSEPSPRPVLGRPLSP